MASTVYSLPASRNQPDCPHLTIITPRSLVNRLLEELIQAFTEVVADPIAFVRDAFASQDLDKRRQKRIYVGLLGAVAAHVVLAVVIVIAGWQGLRNQAVAAAAQDTPKVTWIPPREPRTELKPEVARGDGGGGGGGGQNSPTPASGGPRPFMAPIPQVVDISPSRIETPSLPVLAVVVGPKDDEPPPPASNLGDPNKQAAEYSGGSGSNDGHGSGSDGGVGDTKGPGFQGTRGGGGGSVKPGTAGEVDGTRVALSPFDYGAVTRERGFASFVWTYQSRAIVTPEAQAAKSLGTVLFKVTLTADGRITDVVVVQPVEFMTESATEALMRCRFKPATLNGRPITLRRVPIKIDVHY